VNLKAAPRFIGEKVKERIWSLWREEDANDIVEYALLVAFLSLVGAALFIGMGNNTSALWQTVNSRMAVNQGS
jgi:Flp pilus assembly pilin Flp